MPEYYEEEEPSFLSKVGSFLWTAIKWIAVAALVVTGAVLLSDTVSGWVNKVTGGADDPNKGWGTIIRDKARGLYDGAKDLGGKAVDGVKHSLGIYTPEEKTKLAEDKTVQSTDQKVENVETGAALVGGVAAVRLTPAMARAGIDATKATGGVLGSFIPQGAKDAVGQTANGIRNAWRFMTFRDPVPYTGGATKVIVNGVAKSAQWFDAAGNAIKPGVAATKGFGTIATEFGAKAGPVLGVAAKALAPVSAVASGMEGFSHANELEKLGKDGAATTERVSTVAESTAMVGSLAWAPLAVIGSTAKDLTSMTHYIATGENTVNPGVISGFVKKHNFLYLDTILGGAGNLIGDGINYVRGVHPSQLEEKNRESRERLQIAVEERMKGLSEAEKYRMKEIQSNYRYHQGHDLDQAGAYIALMQEKQAAQEQLAAGQTVATGSTLASPTTPAKPKEEPKKGPQKPENDRG